MCSEAQPDESLMLRAKNGDALAFEQIVRRYQNELVNYFHHTGVYQAADDLTQDTFVRLYRYRKRYTPVARLRTFLYVIARHVRVDYIRKEVRRAKSMESARKTQMRAEDVRDRERLNAVDIEGALGSLSGESRDVVVMGLLQGLKYADIGAILGIPEGTVKSRMFNALKKMREYLA